jgi:septal ring-binding cell division protein DamX
MDQPLDLPETPVLTRSHRPSLTGVWLLVVLAVAVGALLLFRARQAGNPPATSPLAAATTPTASALLAATIPPTALPPTAALPTEISAARTPTSRPTPTATAATRPTAIAVAIGAPPRTVAAPGRRQWLARAERDRTLVQRRAAYTIQLELVCELSSLEEAWKFDRRGAMWLLTASHRGRECFRVFWGRYATLDEARAAKASVPRFFFTATNQPAVVSTRSALLR